MEKHEIIPVLKPNDLDEFHFKNIQWQPSISHSKHPFFHINRLENNFQKLNFPLPPHRKTLHDFIYLKKGSSTRSKGLNNFSFKEGEIFFLPSFQITEHEFISDDVEGFFLHFDEKIFHSLSKNYLNDNFPFFNLMVNPVFTLNNETRQNIEPLFERLLQIYNTDNEVDNSLIVSYLMAIFWEIKNVKQPEIKKTKSAFSQITEEYKNALALHIYQKQSIKDYASILNISPNYLNKCVKNCTYKTALDLLNEMLILEAKTLLRYSKLQVAEIAVILCDQTPSNFSRFFKKQTGITPKEFIEMF